MADETLDDILRRAITNRVRETSTTAGIPLLEICNESFFAVV